ncbi:MAG: SPOR domain-containing protein [Devosia sp.]
MSGQRDDTEDLIAELSKLMATDSKPGAAARPASSAPEPRVASTPQTIRIPGVSQPVPATGSQAAVDRLDFGRSPSQATPAPAAPPSSSWQDRLGGKPATNVDPLAAFPSAPAPSDRQDPSIGSGNWRPAIAPNDAEPRPTPGSSGFDFDFGFNRERPEPVMKPAANVTPAPAPTAPRPAPAAFTPAPVASPPAATPVRPVPQPTPFVPQPVPVQQYQSAPPPAAPAAQPVVPTRDAIAELIAAELGTSTQSTFDDAPAVAPASASTVNYVPPAPAPIPEAPAPRPAVAQPRPAPESDRFSTAPVFGLGNRPAGEAAAPKPQLDPMDEIENLIGEAVRVELNMPQPQPHPVRSDAGQANRSAQSVPQGSPVVPPLNAQFAPRRTSLRDSEPGVGGADEAILAAAAASGNEVGRVDSPFDDERPARPRKASRRERQTDERPAPRRRVVREEDERSRGAFRQLVVPAIAGTILVAGGFALYWALGMGHHDGKVPVLAADATPAKTVPPKPADSSAPHSVVMDELGGNAPAASKETLVSRDQTAGTDAAQVASTAPAAASSPDGGLANRKVRTVTVRPDGSIVSGDDSVAGATQLPVGRPNVPSLPGVSVANAAEAPAPNTATAADASAAPSAADNLAMAGTVSADTAPAADNSAPTADNSAVGDPNAPVPLPPLMRTQVASTDTTATGDTAAPTTSTRPSSAVNAVVKNNGAKPMDLIGNLATAADNTPAPAQQPARQAPAATADVASADVATSGGSVAHVQLSSQPSAAGAQSSAASLQKRFGSLWAGGKLQIVKVDLSKGTYYRVMLPTTSLQGAQQLCASIKSSGGDCIAANG